MILGALAFAEISIPVLCVCSLGTFLMGAGATAKIQTEKKIQSIRANPKHYIKNLASDMFQDLTRGINQENVDSVFNALNEKVEGEICGHFETYNRKVERGLMESKSSLEDLRAAKTPEIIEGCENCLKVLREIEMELLKKKFMLRYSSNVKNVSDEPVNVDDQNPIYDATLTRVALDSSVQSQKVHIKRFCMSSLQNSSISYLTSMSRTIGRFDHPNVLQFHEINLFKGHPEAIELVLEPSSLSLDSLLQMNESSWDISKLLKYALQAAMGMQYLEQTQGNVEICGKRNKKLVKSGEFSASEICIVNGEAKIRPEKILFHLLSTNSSDVSRIDFVETEDERRDFRSDLFTFGSILLQIIHKKRIPKTDDIESLLQIALQTQPSSCCFQISKVFDLGKKCVDTDPSIRPKSWFQIVDHLSQACRVQNQDANIGREKSRGLLVLAIDGGAADTFMSLRILEKLEEHLGHQISDVFDVVAGAGTGGLPVLGLGHCAHTAKSVVEKFETCYGKFYLRGASMVERLKKSTVDLKSKALYLSRKEYNSEFRDSSDFSRLFGDDSTIYPPNLSKSPRVPYMLFLAKKEGMSGPCVLCNYNRDDPAFSSTPLGSCDWSVGNILRATFSSLDIFNPFKHIDGCYYFHDPLDHNNPTLVACKEATILGQEMNPIRQIDLVVSVGTASTYSYGKAVKKFCKEKGARYIRLEPGSMNEPLVKSVSNEELKSLRERADDYLDLPETKDLFDEILRIWKPEGLKQFTAGVLSKTEQE